MTLVYSDPPKLELLAPEHPTSTVIAWRRHHFPLDWHAQFGAKPDAPIYLEVGFGDGRHTVRRAQDEPHACFVGLEISSVSILRASKKVRRLGLGNVKLLKAHAGFALRHLFAPHTLHGIVVNFPDPWPKTRHEHRRLLQRPFFELAASRLVAGGAIDLATDHEAYFAFARAEVPRTLFTLDDAPAPAAVFETKYALKWRAQGKPLYFQRFRYRGTPTPPFESLLREETMPHALLHGPPPTVDAFTKQVVPYADGHVIVHDVSRIVSPKEGERLLWRVTVDEPELRQQLLVVTQRRDEDEWIVRIDPFGDPILTATARGAVHAVSEWLLANTELALRRRSY